MGSNMAGHCCSLLLPMLEALPPIGMLLFEPDANEAGLLWCEEEARSARSAVKSMTTLDTDSEPLAEASPEAAEAAAPPTAPSCCSAAAVTAAVEDSEEEEDEDEEECESPEAGDWGGEEELLWLPLAKFFFLSLVKSAVMPGHSKWTQ